MNQGQADNNDAARLAALEAELLPNEARGLPRLPPWRNPARYQPAVARPALTAADWAAFGIDRP